MSQAIYNVEHEKQLLSALIRTPELIAEIPHINEKDFSPVNRVVFNALKNCLEDEKSFSKFILISKLVAHNIKIGDVIEPTVYINALELMGVNDRAGLGIAKELKKTTIRRELNTIGRKIQMATEKEDQKKATDLLADVTTIFNEHVNLVSGHEDNEPVDLYGTIDKFLDHSNTHYETRSIPTPFPIYNDMYGFCDPGNVYCLAARPKVGKSTWVMSMLQQIALKDDKNNFVGLILDTELTTEEVQCRALASLSGVREFYIRHKIYRKFPEMNAQVEAAREKMKPLWKKVDHIFIGGKTLDEQISITRRWVHRNMVKTGKRGIVVLDYFKLNSSDDFDNKGARDITIGKKVDAYKNLAKELNIPVWALVQANRENEDSKSGARISNGNAIAGADMISQFCSNIYLLQRLTSDEATFMNQLTPDSATHTLINIYPRQLGPDEMKQIRLVKYVNHRGKDSYQENYLLYRFQNFNVTEMGTFKDIVDKGQLITHAVQNPHPAPDTSTQI
jgi:replicative DNA helicase